MGSIESYFQSAPCNLVLGAWSFTGAWMLVLGAFPSVVDSWPGSVNYLGHEGVDSVHFLVRLAGALLAVRPGRAVVAALDLADRVALPDRLMCRSRNSGTDL